MILDTWQEKVMETPGNLCLRSGRQVGKSTVIAIKAARYALENPDKLVMVISKTERQAELLFAKILRNIHNIAKTQIMKGKDRPTKKRIKLKNKSVIHCLPAGDTGYGIMGFTIDLLIADEAAFIPEEVWNSVIPALAVTRGNIWLLSTPFVKEGFYYECFKDPTFTSFHTTSEDCPRRDDVFLAHKKSILTRSQYAQMYLGEFIDEFRQFFSDDLIKACCTGKRPEKFESGDYFLGVDVAGMGEDQSTFEIIKRISRRNLIQVENLFTTKTRTTDTTDEIKRLNNLYHFRRIYIDDAGMGIGVLDQLLLDSKTKFKVMGLSNVRRSTDAEEGETKTQKEDLYQNLLCLMERGEVVLLDDDEVKASLKSVQFEYTDDRHGKRVLKINGMDDHIAEGLNRGCWCSKDKDLNIFVHAF